MKVVITSKNPVKINAVKYGFTTCFPKEQFIFQSISVPSGVSDQPISDEETYKGAKQRVEKAIKDRPLADYWIGIEAGVDTKYEEMDAYAWVYLKDKNGKEGKGRSGTFFLPEEIASLVKQGYELGVADDMYFKRVNSKQKDGTIGALTHNIVNRTEYYKQPVIFALIPFLNPELF